MNNLERLAEQGQSIWLDNISRRILENGELKRLIDQGLRGMTSNPTIFEKAIDGSDDYDKAIRNDPDPSDIQGLYDRLTWADISQAADAFRPVFDRTHGEDGYVSIEVAPILARDTAGTIAEAQRIWKALGRPNIMIKVPGTEAGLPAIRQLIGEGLNINVTLIFSLDRYRAVIDAWLSGLEDRLARRQSLDQTASVASFFVSRVDTLVDHLLEQLADNQPSRASEFKALFGQAAVANAKLAYEIFETTKNHERWRRLTEHGAKPQRPLWASTSTKNPHYPDLLYVDNLIGPHTVNTVPPATLDAIFDHVSVDRTVNQGVDLAKTQIRQLEAVGIHMNDVTNQLEQEGVQSFAESFRTLMQGLTNKVERLGLARSSSSP